MNTIIIPQQELDRVEWMKSSWNRTIQTATNLNSLISIVIPAKKHALTTPLKHLPTPSEMLKKIIDGETIQIENIMVRAISPSSKESHTRKQVLLIISARKEQISNIQNIPNVTARLVMPYQEQDKKAWEVSV